MQNKLEAIPSRLQAALNYTKNAEAMKKVHLMQKVVKKHEEELRLFQQTKAPEEHAVRITACTNKINSCKELINYIKLFQSSLFDPVKDDLYKIIAEYVSIRIQLEFKRVNSIVRLLSFLDSETAYLKECITQVRSKPALGAIQAKISECLWMTSIFYKEELSAQITQFKSPQEDGSSSITLKNWREVKTSLNQMILCFKDANKNSDFSDVAEHLEQIADELFDLAYMAREERTAFKIYDAAATTYQEALNQYTTAPDKKYAEITVTLCQVYYQKIQILVDEDTVSNHQRIIKLHEKIITTATRVAETTTIAHATIATNKMEARAYLFTSNFYLYQQENDKTKEDIYRLQFIENAKQFIERYEIELNFSVELRKNYIAAKKAINDYTDDTLAAGNKYFQSAKNAADPKAKEALLKEAIKQFEIAVATTKKGETKISIYAAICDAYSEMLKIMKPAQQKVIYTAMFNITKTTTTIKEFKTRNRSTDLQSDIAKINACSKRCNEYFNKADETATTKSKKSNTRKAMPSDIGLFAETGTKRRKTTDTRPQSANQDSEKNQPAPLKTK